ncbi:transposase [Phenylobacterium koreense]|uniref:Transposase IS801/IS1294 domain-containing protein n=1 Tax=Phenylobacterium koreense TaxID=266125 RepID=A0ABV2EN43_9CAUL
MAWRRRRRQAGPQHGADLLPAAYFPVVFTPPAPVAAVAFQNKAVVYDLLFKAAAETLTTISVDPKRLGARIGLIAVPHTWGSALTHHPHVHCIALGGGLSTNAGSPAARASSCLCACSRLFRRLFLEKLAAAYARGRLSFFGDLADLADPEAFAAHLARPRAGPHSRRM